MIKNEIEIIDKIQELRDLQIKRDKHMLRYSAQEYILEWVLNK